MNRGWLRVIGLIAVATIWGGCTSKNYSALVKERDVPALASALDATAAHPNHTVLVPTKGERGGPEARIAIHKIESPGNQELVVFIRRR
jgi:hypothetical protein